jgi:N utilization substance protein B
MAASRDIRRCAVQALYQFDAGAEPGPTVRESLQQSAGEPDAHERGYTLAVNSWAVHDEADAAVAELTPDWPTHRQPAVDRSILRLAFYEMAHAGTPPKVVINEAVELAREFSTEKSPLFVNAVLDRVYKSRFRETVTEPDPAAGGAE